MRGWLFAILRNQYSKLIRKEARSTLKPRSILIRLPFMKNQSTKLNK